MISKHNNVTSKKRLQLGMVVVLCAGAVAYQQAYAYGTVSRAGCGFLGVLESITYTVFPSERNDQLYVISQQWTRYSGRPWQFRGTLRDGWDTIHTRAGQFFALSNVFEQAGFVRGYHYVYKNGITRRVATTKAGNCNLTNWY